MNWDRNPQRAHGGWVGGVIAAALFGVLTIALWRAELVSRASAV